MDSKSTSASDEARDGLLEIISNLSLEQLALAARHEYDEEAVAPPEGSPGAAFLRDGRDRFVAWVRREERFPTEDEAEDSACALWHLDHPGSQSVQAYVDLGLYYSNHALRAQDANAYQIGKVLDGAAEELACTLVKDYGPQV